MPTPTHIWQKHARDVASGPHWHPCDADRTAICLGHNPLASSNWLVGPSDWKLGGTLIETSAIKPLLAGALSDVPGPYVVSPYALAEQASLRWDEYRDCILRLEKVAQYLDGPAPRKSLSQVLVSDWRP